MGRRRVVPGVIIVRPGLSSEVLYFTYFWDVRFFVRKTITVVDEGCPMINTAGAPRLRASRMPSAHM